jgi:hypothetical protein
MANTFTAQSLQNAILQNERLDQIFGVQEELSTNKLFVKISWEMEKPVYFDYAIRAVYRTNYRTLNG